MMGKNIYIKKVFLLFLMTSLFSFRSANRAAAYDAYDFFDALGDAFLADTTVEFINHTEERIYIATAYQSTKGGWICEGWLKIEPGWSETITFTTRNIHCYYYAESSYGFWADSDGPLVTVIDDDFSYDVDNMKPPEGEGKRNVSFVELVVDEYSYDEYTDEYYCEVTLGY